MSDTPCAIHSCSYYCGNPECIAKQRDELRDSVEFLTWKRDALLAFARDIMEGWPDGDLDGGSRQDIAVKHGILIPCDCGGVENCGREDPDDLCWKLSPMVCGHP